MKNFLILLMSTLLFSCNSEQENSIVTSVKDNTSKVDTIEYDYEAHNEEKPRTSVSTLNSNVLVLNRENLIYVNVSTVSPEKTKLLVNGELLEGDKGLFKIIPKELGTIEFDVIEIIDGNHRNYGRTIINVVSPETTIAEIFEMN